VLLCFNVKLKDIYLYMLANLDVKPLPERVIFGLRGDIFVIVLCHVGALYLPYRSSMG
jgi:hypothetical protein